MQETNRYDTARVLLLDTSLQGAMIGMAQASPDGWRLSSSVHYESPQEAAAALPRMLDECLAREACELKDIDSLLVGVGPGSFTGIKIGLSFAYGLKQACPSLHLQGISALRSLAQAGEKDLWLLAATQTAGYFASKMGDAVDLGIVQGPEAGLAGSSSGWKLILRKGEDRKLEETAIEWPRQVKILGMWPRIEDSLSTMGVAWSRIELAAVKDQILAGMLADYSLEATKPSPLYLRRSAPEEKLANQPSRS